MGYEGSWSGMRKYLEKEMLADSLKGRIRFGCTRYIGMDGWKIFEVCIDNKQVKRFSYETLFAYLRKEVYKKEIITWSDLLDYIENNPVNTRCVYVHWEFTDALAEYRNQDIKFSLNSDNPIVRMFAILDRRVGKRTLKKLKDTLDKQPEWLKQFYALRFEAESL